MAKTTDSHVQAGKFLHETDAALQMELPGGETVWIPFSQIHSIDREANGIDVSVTMSRWIAEKKGML